MTRIKKRRHGRALVEFAIVAPMVFTFLFAIVEYGRFVMFRQLINNALREGARQAAANSPFKYDTTQSKYVTQALTTSDIQNTVISYLAGQNVLNSSGIAISASDISVYRANPNTGAAMTDTAGSNWLNAEFGEAIAVKASVSYKPILPTFHFLQSSTPINFTVLMRSEASL